MPAYYRKHTAEELSLIKSLVEYDSHAGDMTYLKKLKGGRIKRIPCKSINKDGYLQLRVNSRMYTQHRLAWALYYGEFPDGDIDHIDHDRTNNAISNLRVVKRCENNLNISKRGNNTSGYNGVWFSKQITRWIAEARLNNKKVHIGCFKEKTEAVEARAKFDMENGFHENHGK